MLTNSPRPATSCLASVGATRSSHLRYLDRSLCREAIRGRLRCLLIGPSALATLQGSIALRSQKCPAAIPDA
jgi:hypothetical protein